MGRGYFLIEGPPGEAERAGKALAEGLAPFGFDPVPTALLLDEFHSVERAYLETFRLLGGLGLLLGAAGLGAVLLRGTLEWRELALLRALGYPRSALAAMVMAQDPLLLVAGIGLGAVSAIVPAAPLLRAGSPVALGPLVLMLLAAALVGLAAGAAAAAAALRAPLMPALRSE